MKILWLLLKLRATSLVIAALYDMLLNVCIVSGTLTTNFCLYICVEYIHYLYTTLQGIDKCTCFVGTQVWLES
jgi:hypothetical protein